MDAVHDYPNGANGANGTNGVTTSFPPARFSAVPQMLSIAGGAETGDIYDIEVSLEEDIMPTDPYELCAMLETERASRTDWMNVAVAYAKHKKVDLAIEILTKGNIVFAHGRSEDRLGIYNALCWLYLLKCREAPRVKPGKATFSAHAEYAAANRSRQPT
jgi:RNA polymerase-associated protein CTR9